MALQKGRKSDEFFPWWRSTIVRLESQNFIFSINFHFPKQTITTGQCHNIRERNKGNQNFSRITKGNDKESTGKNPANNRSSREAVGATINFNIVMAT
jgi:hypothetical protein